MSGLILSNNERYLWAVESTLGTDAVEPILTDGTMDIVYQQTPGLTITPEGEVVHVARARGSASGNRHGVTKGRATIAGDIPVQAFISSTDQVPYADPILRAMGMSVDLGTTEESTYSPQTAENVSLTIYKYHRLAESSEWRLTVTTGVVLTGTLTLAMSAEPVITLEGGGSYTTLGDSAEFFNSDGSIALLKDGTTSVAARTTGTEIVADQDPLMCAGVTITVDGTERTVSAFEMALNKTVTQLQSITGATTTARHVITTPNQGSRIGGSFTLTDYEDAEVDALFDDYHSAKEMSASAVFGGASGRVTLSMPKMQIGLSPGADSDGIYQFEVPYFLNGDWSDLAADNDFTLKFDEMP